jgi:hypothetical protein
MKKTASLTLSSGTNNLTRLKKRQEIKVKKKISSIAIGEWLCTIQAIYKS